MKLRLTRSNNTYISFFNLEVGCVGFYRGVVKDYNVEGKLSIGYAIIYNSNSKRFSIWSYIKILLN